MSCWLETLMVACQRRRHKGYNNYDNAYDTYNSFLNPIPWRTQKKLKGTR